MHQRVLRHLMLKQAVAGNTFEYRLEHPLRRTRVAPHYAEVKVDG